MTPEIARRNLREVIGLMLDAVERDANGGRWFCHHFHRHTSMGDVAELHVNAGLLTTFDFALPQSWFDSYIGWARSTGVVYSGVVAHDTPVGVVWCYDGAGYTGAPYALTERAQTALDAFLRAMGGRRG